jgi:uncharacterized protein YhhL (DUF1145 family)
LVQLGKGWSVVVVELCRAFAMRRNSVVTVHARYRHAHTCISWAERLTRNGRVPTAHQVRITLFGVPEAFATSLGLATV